jgi:hypothetical protein
MSLLKASLQENVSTKELIANAKKSQTTVGKQLGTIWKYVVNTQKYEE